MFRSHDLDLTVDTAWFIAVVEVLAGAARREALRVPSFRSPPRLAGSRRSIGRTASGRVVVAVTTSGRCRRDVAGDLIDGILAANGLLGPPGAAARQALWAEVTGPGPGHSWAA